MEKWTLERFFSVAQVVISLASLCAALTGGMGR